jgi:erythromycin esterase
MRELSRVVALLSVALVFTSGKPVVQQSTQSAAQVEPQQLEQHRPVERTLGGAKEIHAYTVALEPGQFLDATVNQRGVDVVVRVFAPDGKLVAEIDSPTGEQGDEPIALQAKSGGRYRIEVTPFDPTNGVVGRYEIRLNEIVSAAEYAKRLADLKMKQQAVIARLKENVVPIKTVEAGSGFADLLPLKRVFKDVQFVGLGEETHGTREFFQFKHRMLEFLVKEMGFRVFAIEASYSACQNINDYVMGTTDDGAKALDSQGFWTWNTEEVRAMIDWMREYNKSVPADGRVKFVGFDIQVNDTGKNRLIGYLRRVAPERFAEVDALFRVNMDEFINAVFLKRDGAKEELEKLNGLRKQYNDLFVFLELNGPTLAAKSSEPEYEQMREYARVLVQYADAYSQPGFGSQVTRDLYMADNFRRIVEREPAGTRFVVWAHNGHIATGDSDGGYPTLGHHLRRFYGQKYYALGFSFNQGSFQSREGQPKDPQNRMLMSFTVGPATVDSVDWFLAQTGAKILVVDFRSSRKSMEIGDWLAAPHPMRSIGAMYAPGTQYFLPITLGREFDGLFFVDTANRARPNPSVKNAATQ